MNKFKVGDRLKVVDGPKNLIDEYKDLIVTVTCLGSELSLEDIVATSDKYDSPLVFMPDWTLELVEETVKYEVIYPTIPDDVNKVKSFSNVFIRSGNSWLDITNNNEVMSERYMLRTYGPLTPVEEEPKKYNLARRINGNEKDLMFVRPVSLEAVKYYLEERLKGRYMRAVSIDYVEGDHLHIVERDSESTHWDIEEA